MIAIAGIVRDTKSTYERQRLSQKFADMLGESNPLFDEKRFYMACGAIPPLSKKCTSNRG